MEKGAGGTAAVKDSTGGDAKPDSIDKEQRAMEILRKPLSEWTEEDHDFMEEYETLEPDPAGNPVDAIGIVKTISAFMGSLGANIAVDVTLDMLMKYAGEELPGGDTGVAIAAAVFSLKKGNSSLRDMPPAQRAIIEKVMRDGKTRKRLRSMYDSIVRNGFYFKTEAEKLSKKAGTGAVSAEEALVVKNRAKRENPSLSIDGYKTEASQLNMEHAMMKHGSDDVKAQFTKEKMAHGDTVRESYRISETQRGNVPLTKEDFAKIHQYREQAVKSGNVEFQPIAAKKKFESILYKVPQKDGVIHIAYRIDPVEKKLTFATMYKEKHK
ncbi:MAG: hypothetical protein HQL01_08465 [Nitrospirae bacterium]|nr:hypothetical protein [Nitrospirota bacterium]